MAEEKKKWEGRADQVGGKVKEVTGKVTGNEDMEAEGKVDQAKGKAKETFGKGKEKVKEAID
jgi:uncharacterized protein YjbJ (UPF0337 family)